MVRHSFFNELGNRTYVSVGKEPEGVIIEIMGPISGGEWVLTQLEAQALLDALAHELDVA